mmetsp:Transcript_24635/g.68680  ORF Transcript_24635/g.68680 Transcript_24635/m.68680 type:complete len:192 (+) Transcript_24635:1759-2334(+)
MYKHPIRGVGTGCASQRHGFVIHRRQWRSQRNARYELPAAAVAAVAVSARSGGGTGGDAAWAGRWFVDFATRWAIPWLAVLSRPGFFGSIETALPCREALDGRPCNWSDIEAKVCRGKDRGRPCRSVAERWYACAAIVRRRTIAAHISIHGAQWGRGAPAHIAHEFVDGFAEDGPSSGAATTVVVVPWSLM